VRQWYGDERPDDPSYAPALAAARRGALEGLELLRKVLRRRETPDIVQATAAELLVNYPGQQADALCRQMIDDPSPLVRSAALGALSSDALRRSVDVVSERLHDPVRSVRFAAAERLLADGSELPAQRHRGPLEDAVAEYRQAQQMVLDRAAGHINLGMLSQRLGDDAAARKSLETALRLEPYLSGVRDELARIIERIGGDQAEVTRLREEEVDLLARDAKLLPGNSQPLYRQGMLLFLLGRLDEARESFEAACRVAPNSYDNWLALALLCERQQDWDRALEALGQMYQLRPDDPAIRGILGRIRAAGGLEHKELD
jgi:tetratricopeptide (TPR) repeat protein